MALGLLASLGGLCCRLAPFTPTSRRAPTIVLLALAGFALTWPVGVVAAAPASAAEPFPARTRPSRAAHDTIDEHHGTSTARTAGTWPCGTATTSTTSTTGTGTRRTESHYDEH